MQTTYNANRGIALEGTPVGERRSKSLTLAWLAQQSQIRIASSESGTLTITITDDESGQVYTLPVTLSGAVEATSLDEMLAAWQANGIFNNLATVTEDGADDLVITFRHANRSYTVATTPPGSMTAVVSELQASGGAGVAFGRMVMAGAADESYQALTATATLAQLEGILFRTDGNHLHSLENDTPTAVDVAERGRTYSIMEKGRCYVQVEDAVTPTSSVFVRRALTASAGAVGRFRGTAAGGQESWTFTPSAVNLPGYGFEFDYQGVHYTALYLGDGTTTVAQACDGLVQDLGTIAGLTITDGGTEVTIQTAAGTQLQNVRNLASHTDVPVDSVTLANTVAADIDTIDISSIARFETSAAAGGLARLRLHMVP